MPVADTTPNPVIADQLADRLSTANPAVLAATLADLTGDVDRARGFLADLSYGFQAGPVAELSASRRRELVAWATEVGIDVPDRSGALLSDADFLELAGGLVGWPLPADSAHFYREQGGFVDFVSATRHPTVDLRDVDLLVIGAGMAGIAAAVGAGKAGIRYRVLEKADQIGGVWQQNTYPGVGVDTPSAYYSFSFEVNQEWSGVYPTGEEYLRYLNRVVDKYGVREHLTLGADVRQLRWSQDDRCWIVTYLDAGVRKVATARAVMTAAGYLTRPQLPQVPGLAAFEGEWFHSAEWNHDYDFTGKRLAVVGTGCTSVQIVDALVDKVASLTLVQRQPHWVMPPGESLVFPEDLRWLNLHVPGYARWSRLLTFIPISDFNYPVVRYDEEWAATHDLSISPANDQVLQFALGHLEASFAGRTDLIERLKPGFAPFGKRTIRDPGSYYAALTLPTSTVASGLARVVPNGLVDSEGNLHEVDVIVYATGFALDYLGHVEIVGSGGERLADRWGTSPVAYNGVQVPGFPNLFITSGPHASPSHGGGHNFTVEATVHYVIESLRELAARRARTVEPTEDALARWKAQVDELMADSVWAREKRATTYYRNDKGEVVLASPLTMLDYWNRLRGPADADLVYGG